MRTTPPDGPRGRSFFRVSSPENLMKPFAVDDLYLHRTILGLDGSASHLQTVFVVSQAVKDGDKYKSSIWSLDPSGESSPRQLTMTLFDAKSPRLDPHGNRLA